MSTFELIPSATDSARPGVPSSDGLGKAILLHNAHWFTHVRWIVVAVFALVGLVAHAAPGVFRSAGIDPPSAGLLRLAGSVALANVVFSLLARRLRGNSSLFALRSHLWLQILADLFAVTVLVHMVGSVNTFVPFTYLFHIVLACIFFSRRHSFAITVLATGLYLTCVGLEIAGFGRSTSIFLDLAPLHQVTPRTAILMALSAVFVWFVVWYFAATLSLAVRQRDAKLLAANARLVRADEEKNRMVLRTVHDLKAPFTGIESNIQLLRVQFWDLIPESVQDIVDRIAVRAKALRERIHDILALSDLRSGHAQTERPAPFALREFLQELAEPLAEEAARREVRVAISAPPISLVAQKERLRILVSNLLANAIFYSHPGGGVEVTAAQEGNAVVLRVSDHGIGIEADALPHIFEEYYRTPEAAAFNKASTGLGLAIVREVAQQLGLRITVTSEHGKGTTFGIWIPRKEPNIETGE